MRGDKGFIIKLRSEGKSYRDIQKITGVSRGTLYKWFHTEDWSKQVTNRLNEKNPAKSKERMIRFNLVRKLKFQYEYALVQSQASKQYEQFSKDPLFLDGLIAYLKHGDLKSKYLLRFSSNNVKKHQIFRDFYYKYLDNKGLNPKYQLYMYSNIDQNDLRVLWAKDLNIAKESFYKTQVIKTQNKQKTLQFGYCVSIISSTRLKNKILKWLELYNIDKNAGMV